jgi:hypothetical protein
VVFPTIVNKGTSYASSALLLDHPIDLPDSLVNGRIVLVVVGSRASTTTYTWPSGWIAPTAWTDGGNNGSVSIRYRVVDGSEGSSVTVSLNAAQQAVAWPWQISGQHTDAPVASARINYTGSITPDPPNLTPSWGAEDDLWIAGFAHGGTSGGVTGYPTSYADNQEALAATGTTVVEGAIATRNLNATSDDPGTFSVTTSRQGVAFTLAIRPAAAVAAVSLLMRPGVRRMRPLLVR